MFSGAAQRGTGTGAVAGGPQIDIFQVLMTRISTVFARLGTDVTDRMDAIAETLTGECDLDQSESVSGVSLPVHEAALLDTLRKQRPALYAEVLERAGQIWDTPVIGRRRIACAAAASVGLTVG